jgi:hypothetical protein
MKKFLVTRFVEIMALITMLGLLMIFVPRIYADCVSDENTECFEYWQNDLAIEIKKATDNFYLDIDEDPTDTGCLYAEMRLKDKINSILFSYRMKIYEEMNGEFHDEEVSSEISQNDEDEKLLDAHGAWQDAIQFQD